MTQKYTVKTCSGYFVDDTSRVFNGIRIALESWDGVEDSEDESIFYYMDNQPLKIGDTIACDSFTVTHIE